MFSVQEVDAYLDTIDMTYTEETTLRCNEKDTAKKSSKKKQSDLEEGFGIKAQLKRRRKKKINGETNAGGSGGESAPAEKVGSLPASTSDTSEANPQSDSVASGAECLELRYQELLKKHNTEVERLQLEIRTLREQQVMHVRGDICRYVLITGIFVFSYLRCILYTLKSTANLHVLIEYVRPRRNFSPLCEKLPRKLQTSKLMKLSPPYENLCWSIKSASLLI